MPFGSATGNFIFHPSWQRMEEKILCEGKHMN
jgi:hypothetical protein